MIVFFIFSLLFILCIMLLINKYMYLFFFPLTIAAEEDNGKTMVSHPTRLFGSGSMGTAGFWTNVHQ